MKNMGQMSGAGGPYGENTDDMMNERQKQLMKTFVLS